MNVFPVSLRRLLPQMHDGKRRSHLPSRRSTLFGRTPHLRSSHNRWTAGMVAKLTLGVASVALLATPSPGQVVLSPHGERSLGLDGTIDKFYAGTHRAIIKAADGADHLVHVTRDTRVHGVKHTHDEPFGDLQDGSHVIVHYVMKGDTKEALEIDRIGEDGLSVADGVVMDVDRPAKKLTIQLDDGTPLTLRLTERAANDVGKDVGRHARVVVYYADDGDALEAHYFKKVK